METLDYDVLEKGIEEIETIDDVKTILQDRSDFVYSIDEATKEGEVVK